jgi:predicted ATP-grasp superfamily ATP-dependent carboligase
MRVFVYEYTCGGGLTTSGGGQTAGPLRAEGWAMLSAVVEDLERVGGVEVRALLDEGCGYEPKSRSYVRIGAGEETTGLRDLARWADATLVVAPEFESLLATRCRWVEEAGGCLLGPSVAAVELTGDKLALGRYLRQRGVPTPPVAPAHGPAAAVGFPAVWKPRYGAGSLATFLVRTAGAVAACADAARAEGWDGEAMLQTFVPGFPASVAFLVGPGRQLPLLPAAQELSADGRFYYLGGTLPLPPALADRAVRLARRAVTAVPGLRGYVGVDLVLGDASDGSGDWVIEINPRLTTSYVGLRALAQTNLAEALLRVARGETQPALTWRPGVVRFRADGAFRGR